MSSDSVYQTKPDRQQILLPASQRYQRKLCRWTFICAVAPAL